MNLENRIKKARYKANKKLIGERDLRKRLEIASKNEAGYSSYFPSARALGFKDGYSISLIHEYTDGNIYIDRLYAAINTLLIEGYEITIPEELAKKDLNQ